MSKKIHLLIILALCGCSTSATLELSDLPNPVYIDTETGEATVPPHTEGKPADAIPYSDLITMISESGYSPYIVSKVNYSDNHPYDPPRIDIAANNINFSAWDSYYYPYVTYFGDRFIRNEHGFAEQTSGRIPAKYLSYDDFIATKLVLGGGATGLKYTDFGYWIGVSENPYTNPFYIAFTMQGGGHQSYTGSTIYATYTGRTAAVAYNNTIPGSARELGGDATLTVSSSGSNLVLDFDDYYKFTIDSPYSYGNGITSVKVEGTNTNGGPEFTSCTSGCKAYGDIDYYGEYRAEEAIGTYRYIDDTNTLVGSFGAKRD